MKVIEFNSECGRLSPPAVTSLASGAVDRTLAGPDAARAGTGSDSRSRTPSAWLVLALLRFYMVFLSPVFGGACKFYPSCSNYAVEAVTKHGARRGLVLAAKRLLRCRPFTQGGFDPVPDDLPHSRRQKVADGKARALGQVESEIQRTERRIL